MFFSIESHQECSSRLFDESGNRDFACSAFEFVHEGFRYLFVVKASEVYNAFSLRAGSSYVRLHLEGFFSLIDFLDFHELVYH